MYSVQDLVANPDCKKVQVTLKSLTKEGKRRIVEGELFCVDNNTNPTTLVVGNVPMNDHKYLYNSQKAIWGVQVVSMSDVSTINFPDLNQRTDASYTKPTIDDYYGELKGES